MNKVSIILFRPVILFTTLKTFIKLLFRTFNGKIDTISLDFIHKAAIIKDSYSVDEILNRLAI